MIKKKQYPLMPQATAVWLVDNTSLTFKQIANFCGIHELEVKGIADGDVCNNVKAIDPVVNNQLTKEEIERCTNNKDASLTLKTNREYDDLREKASKRSKYIPVARRQDKPDAAYWILKNHPEVKDFDIIKLIGITKTTLEAIKNRSHWNIAAIRQRDPVLLGICSQIDLDRVIGKAQILQQKSEQDK